MAFKGRRISWRFTGEPGDGTEGGYWESYEGRFSISPNFRSTVYPDSYSVRDNLKDADYRYRDTVGECKDWANDIIERENA